MNTKKSLLCAAVSALIFCAPSIASAEVVRTCKIEVTYVTSISKKTFTSYQDGSPGAGATVLMARKDSAENTINDFSPFFRATAEAFQPNYVSWVAIGEYVTIKGKLFSAAGGSGCKGTIGPYYTKTKTANSSRR